MLIISAFHLSLKTHGNVTEDYRVSFFLPPPSQIDLSHKHVKKPVFYIFECVSHSLFLFVI